MVRLWGAEGYTKPSLSAIHRDSKIHPPSYCLLAKLAIIILKRPVRVKVLELIGFEIHMSAKMQRFFSKVNHAQTDLIAHKGPFSILDPKMWVLHGKGTPSMRTFMH